MYVNITTNINNCITGHKIYIVYIYVTNHYRLINCLIINNQAVNKPFF